MVEFTPAIDGFETARPLRRLAAGPVADSWLVAHEGRQLVLRKDRPCAARIGLDRDREFRILQAMHGHGLAPEPLAWDRQSRVLVTTFVPGAPWGDHPGLTDPWSRLGALLRRLHTLRPDGVPRFQPATVLEGYGEAAGTPEARALGEELAGRAAPLYRDAPWVLCHHDPHLGNVIGDPGVFIDWEYAALGHPLFDLAFVIEYHALDERSKASLLTGWSGETPPVPLQELDDFRAFVADVNALWAMAVSDGH